MKPIAGPLKAQIVILSLLSFNLLFIIDGCKEDSSSPTSFTPTYPAAAGQWSGAVLYGPRFYDVTLSIAQSESTLSGTSLWITRPAGSETKCWFKGTINMNRELAFRETSYVAQNWSGVGWELALYTGLLNTKGDSLYLTWKVSSGGTGNFVVIKR